jgi:hypothetical protein
VPLHPLLAIEPVVKFPVSCRALSLVRSEGHAESEFSFSKVENAPWIQYSTWVEYFLDLSVEIEFRRVLQ